MLKTALLITVLSLNGCASLPPFPEVWQCAWAGNPRAFYCKNTETGKHLKIDATSSDMYGAQCLSAEDYRRSQEWITEVIDIAKRRCK